MKNISVIIPTLNEAATIVEALDALRAALPGAEVIVADGGSADATMALAAPLARVVVAPRGRARQMNAGAQVATGDLLLFLHADTRLPPAAGAALEETFRDGRVVAGAFTMRFDDAGLIYRAMAWGNNLRSRLRQTATGDQAIVVRRAVFLAIGGYADIPLMEDVEIWPRLRGQGAVRLLRPPVTVSARRHRRHGPLRVLVTGWVYQILYRLGVPPFALHRLYYGRPPE